MATHTFYLTDTAAVSPGWYGLLQDGGTPPTSVRTLGLANTGKIAVGSFCRGQMAGCATSNSSDGTISTTSLIDGKTGPTVGTANSTMTVVGDCWITPATLVGTFASGTWTIAVGLRAGTTANQGRFRMRVWRSVNADGSSATEVTTSTQLGSVSGVTTTTTTVTSTISWSAPSFTVTNEYLFFQVEFQEQTSAGSASTTKLALMTGSATTIATTDLSLGAPFMFPRSKPYKRR